ncbi:NAD(P)H-dependent oxidoreductase [Shewanella sp. NIFS-20-20]|nr:NAD(P)H-dependent oxidoreductase [Shewanella sp. NIFS-20-20]
MTRLAHVLVLCAHPAIQRSEVNRGMFDIATKMDGVTAIDLYAQYPDFAINVAAEQQRLIDHDVIIFQFPLFWYSTPALLKEWQDAVLQYGFAYGKGGNSLAGKSFLCAISAGGYQSTYAAGGVNHQSITTYIVPLEQTATLCQMHYVPPLVLYGAGFAKQQQRLESHLQDWQSLLATCVDACRSGDSVAEAIVDVFGERG